MNLTQDWLTAAARWAATQESSGPVEVAHPTGVVHTSIRHPDTSPSESFVEARSIVLTWGGPICAAEYMPRRVWRPWISGLPETIAIPATRYRPRGAPLLVDWLTAPP